MFFFQFLLYLLYIMNDNEIFSFCQNITKLCSTNNTTLNDDFTNKYNYISFERYVKRSSKYLNIKSSELVSIFIYFQRMIQSNNTFNENHIHTLYGVLTMLFYKMYIDDPYLLEVYSSLFGIYRDKLHNLELKILNMLDYNLIINKSELDVITIDFFK
jgi:hypothetical protein